jgi:hypothetical protein
MVFKLKNGMAFILGLSIIFYTGYGLEITTGYFRVNTHSKDLNSCAVKLLSKVMFQQNIFLHLWFIFISFMFGACYVIIVYSDIVKTYVEGHTHILLN